MLLEGCCVRKVHPSALRVAPLHDVVSGHASPSPLPPIGTGDPIFSRIVLTTEGRGEGLTCTGVEKFNDPEGADHVWYAIILAWQPAHARPEPADRPLPSVANLEGPGQDVGSGVGGARRVPVMPVNWGTPPTSLPCITSKVGF